MTQRRRIGLRGAFAFCVVAAATLSFSASGFARNNPEKVGTGAVTGTSFVPRSLSNQQTTVVVQLSGKSVAEVQASTGRKLTKAEKQQIKSQLKASQDSLLGSIQAAGGTVLNQFQSAINGVKVQIAERNVAKLQALPGVVAVLTVQTYRIDNVSSVPYIGTPNAWTATGGPFTGVGEKIAVIDTGIDYTHANFGGPGTIIAFTNADATDTLPANPLLFGPGAVTKVKGGFDFVGDDYDADGTPAQKIPHPDPNPLDCNGHGSHVAGTAAGFGVTSGGATYAGPWDGTTYPGSFKIGPGVAPQADLYALRVFGCEGSTNVVVDAIDWAVDNDMDVINMSLGSPFGMADTADAVASDNAALAGVFVATSAGNEGPSPYMVGTPGTAKRAISTAAMDRFSSLPGFTVALTNPTASLIAQNSNNATLSDGTVYNVKYIVDDPNTTTVDESLGCSPASFGTVTSNDIAVVHRGTCARAAKAIYGQQAGAGAVAMVNNASGYPPFEGPITSNPDTGVPFTVTIPFLGILGPAGSADDLKLSASGTGGGTATLTNSTISNPGFKAIASFSSGGPRVGDSGFKPEITAPGVSIFSTAIGTGTEGTFISGTSMASPHVAGVAALTKQAHPGWDTNDIKAAIVNTATTDPSVVAGYSVRLWGAGLVQPAGSVGTNVVAFAKGSGGETGLSFGFDEISGGGTYTEDRTIQLVNHGGSAVTFDVSVVNSGGSAHTLSLTGGTPVTVPANSTIDYDVQLQVPKSTIGNVDAFRSVRGQILFDPNVGENNDLNVVVPYFFVPRALSIMTSKASAGGSVDGPSFKNKIKEKASSGGSVAGYFDWYAWGLSDPMDANKGQPPAGAQNAHDVRAVGVQSFPDALGPGSDLIGFAVNTWRRFSNAAENEWDIGVDVDLDGTVDYIVVGVDEGAVLTGDFNGVLGSFVFSTRSAGASIFFNAFAPTDGSTAVMYVDWSQLCRSGEPCLDSSNPEFAYDATGFDLLDPGSVDPVDNNNDGELDVAMFNALHPAMTPFAFGQLAPGSSTHVNLKVHHSYTADPFLGLMSVHYDNQAGASEAELVPLTVHGTP